MEQVTLELSVLQRFGFEDPPVGVKFLYRRPDGVEQLEKKLAICEMIGEAQRRDAPFYITKENEDCFGAVALGMTETPPFAEAGQIGYELKIFREPRANSRIYYYLPKLHKGTVNYVVFAKLDKINFDPDLLIILANVGQAEIIFRALDHLSGGPRESKTTGVFGCAWIFAYPYTTGKVNFTVTGLHFGSKAKKAFKKEGMILISLPFDWIPILTKGLREIIWELPGYKQGPEEFKAWEKEMLQRLMETSKNP
jgi:uncharacterized protein (DUF169 family)